MISFDFFTKFHWALKFSFTKLIQLLTVFLRWILLMQFLSWIQEIRPIFGHFSKDQFRLSFLWLIVAIQRFDESWKWTTIKTTQRVDPSKWNLNWISLNWNCEWNFIGQKTGQVRLNHWHISVVDYALVINQISGIEQLLQPSTLRHRPNYNQRLPAIIQTALAVWVNVNKARSKLLISLSIFNPFFRDANQNVAHLFGYKLTWMNIWMKWLLIGAQNGKDGHLRWHVSIQSASSNWQIHLELPSDSF